MEPVRDKCSRADSEELDSPVKTDLKQSKVNV